MDAHEQHDRRFHDLAEAMRAFALATTDYKRLLDIVAEQVSDLIGDGCVVMLLSDDETLLLPGSLHFRDPQISTIARELLPTGPVRVDGPTLGAHVARTGESVLLRRADAATLARELSPEYAAFVARLGVRSFIALPLVSHGRVLGIVVLLRVGDEAVPFTLEDEAVARNLAEHAALAISNAQLLESLQRELRERRRAEEEASRFAALIQHSGEFIAMAGLDGRILFVNDGGRHLLGIEPNQDLAELRLADFHTDEGMKRGPVIREKGRWQGRGQLRNVKTGELIDTQVSSFLVRDTEGNPFGFATVQQDIRETKRLETHLRQAQKMEAIGTLAGGIAHDFNNILGAILGNVELARMERGRESTSDENLNEIAKAGQRANALVKQILTFGRQQETTKLVIRLADVVKEVVSMLRSTIPASVELVTSIADGTPNVLADTTQIHQVLLNLCTNAWQALEGRPGRININLTGIVIEGESSAPESEAQPGRYACLEVTDDGSGIDAGALERIFDPFFTTKSPGEGTGLGLSVVHGIVKDHRGTISVDSKPGEGATFRVLLPAVEGDAARNTGEAASPLHGRGQHILYLDDEAPLVRTTKLLLESLGYRVTGFTRADEALEAIQGGPQQFDVVLTDLNMPGLSGLQIARLLASLRPELPVILTSGYLNDELREKAARVGVRQVLSKPSSVDELSDALRRITERAT